MKVYVVEWWNMGYENGLSGVFSTEEKANEWVKEQEKEHHASNWHWVTEVEVDGKGDAL